MAVIVAWVLAEVTHREAARPAPVVEPVVEPVETLLVLGCPSDKRGRPSPMQRWRIDLAARNASSVTSVVFTGAHEARVMAEDLIARYGIDPVRVTCENEATNTWENIGFSADLIAPGGIVRIISDPLHARRAAGYWRIQRPERADELRPAALYRFGERPVLKVLSAGYEVLLRGLRYRPARR